jgi:hypothetical protein
MEVLDVSSALSALQNADADPASSLPTLRALRSSLIVSADARAALLSAGGPAFLCGLSRRLPASPSGDALLATRVALQVLVNLCAGSSAGQGAVWCAALAAGAGGECALAACAVAAAAASDGALAGVVLGCAYTCVSACAPGGEEGPPRAAAAARLRELCAHPTLLPALLRLCLPRGGGEGGAAAAAVEEWAALLAAALLDAGVLPQALAAAARGLSALQLLGSGGCGGEVTAEAVALLRAAEAAVADSPPRSLRCALAAAAPALCEVLRAACTEALQMSDVVRGGSGDGGGGEGGGGSGGGGGGGGGSLDTGPLLLLPRLHAELCVRAAETAAGLLSDGLACLSEGEESGGTAVAAHATEEALLAGGQGACALSALLALLASATPATVAPGAGAPPGAPAAGAGAPPPPHPSAALFSRRLALPAPPGLRPALMRALALALHGGGEAARLRAVRAGGVPVVLAQTRMDGTSVTLREWALLAARFWCEGEGAAALAARAEVQAVREGLVPGAKVFPDGVS